jgi:indole-3-glycerol phosphate synthase
VEVAHPSDGETAGPRGADGIVLRGAPPVVAGESPLPVLVYGATPDAAAAAGADAVVRAASTDPEELEALARRAEELGLEVVVQVADEDEFERVLDELDPEILLLSADEAEDDQHPLDRVLELLPDVPAGMLAIADLATATREEIEELERAGVDAVVVAGDVGGLAGDAPPVV